jgi:hypothetical protein
MRKEHPNRDLSTALRFGRDEQGKGSPSEEERVPNGRGERHSRIRIASLRPKRERYNPLFRSTLDFMAKGFSRKVDPH